MAQTCTKCSRVNPADAAYCYYDGSSSQRAGRRRRPGDRVRVAAVSEPVRLSRRPAVCRNFDQLAMACQQNWSAALDLLKQGYLEKFLAGLGRADLAMAAREAARFPDHDRGLDQFLAKLPSQAVPAAQAGRRAARDEPGPAQDRRAPQSMRIAPGQPGHAPALRLGHRAKTPSG